MVYTAAVIGCGKIGSEYANDTKITGIYTHAGAYTASRKTELVAVCDMDSQKRRKCRERWNVPSTYADYQTMIEETRPDIVSVCTPDPTHYRILMAILKKGQVRAILAEKPLATTYRQAKKIAAIADERGVVLAVNYPRRYARNHVQARTRILAGRSLGTVRTVTGYYTNGVMHTGTHWFDLARFLVGEIIAVRGYDACDRKADDPTPDVHLEFAGGARGYLAGGDRDSFGIFEMDILCSNGRVRISESGNRIEYYTVGDDPNYSGYMALRSGETDRAGLGDVLLHAVEDVTRCLDTGERPVCSGDDGVKAVAIASAACTSVRTKRRIPVP